MNELPRELGNDFPEPVHSTAARAHELREQLDALRRAMAPSREYEARVLGKFPGEMHEGGPVPPMDSPHPGWLDIHGNPKPHPKVIGCDYGAPGGDRSKYWNAGDYVIPQGTLRDAYEELRARGGVPVQVNVPDATVTAQRLTCHHPNRPISATVEADCPCGRHLYVNIPRWLA